MSRNNFTLTDRKQNGDELDDPVYDRTANPNLYPSLL